MCCEYPICELIAEIPEWDMLLKAKASSAPVTYPLGDMHNGVQDAQSPHICVPSNPLPLSCLQGISVDREIEGKRQGLGMREEQHISVFGSQANIISEFRVEGFHCIMFSGHFCIITTTTLVRP